jgi:hypothetical protein
LEDEEISTLGLSSSMTVQSTTSSNPLPTTVSPTISVTIASSSPVHPPPLSDESDESGREDRTSRRTLGLVSEALDVVKDSVTLILGGDDDEYDGFPFGDFEPHTISQQAEETGTTSTTPTSDDATNRKRNRCDCSCQQ